MKRENRLANLDIQSKRKIKIEKNKNIHTEAIKMYDVYGRLIKY